MTCAFCLAGEDVSCDLAEGVPAEQPRPPPAFQYAFFILILVALLGCLLPDRRRLRGRSSWMGMPSWRQEVPVCVLGSALGVLVTCVVARIIFGR